MALIKLNVMEAINNYAIVASQLLVRVLPDYISFREYIEGQIFEL